MRPCTDVKDVAAQRCPALLTCVAHLLRWPDTTVGLRFVLGFRCIGAIEAPGLFRELDEAPPHSLGLQTLLGQHATNIFNKLELSMPRFPHSAEAKAFTLQEIQQGIAEGPSSRRQLDARSGEGQWVPMRRFMLPQSSKLRAIDDGRFSGHNQASHCEETIFTVSPDFAASACKELLRLLRLSEGQTCDLPSWAEPQFGTVDMSSAYRQLPNAPSEAQAMVVCFFDPDCKDLRFARLKAHPYGLSAAVINFNRVPAIMTTLVRLAAAVCAANYFDDSGLVDLSSARGSGQAWVNAAYGLAGLILDQVKEVPMASQRPFLGVLLDLTGVLHDAVLRVGLKPGLADALQADIDRVLETSRLTSAEASKLRGKLTWASCGMFGKCGRAGQAPLVQRQYRDTDAELTTAITRALHFYSCLLQTVKPREILLGSLQLPPIVCYTDAS